jgi:hypothetical protein
MSSSSTSNGRETEGTLSRAQRFVFKGYDAIPWLELPLPCDVREKLLRLAEPKGAERMNGLRWQLSTRRESARRISGAQWVRPSACC